jgi:hypothetical protein
VNKKMTKDSALKYASVKASRTKTWMHVVFEDGEYDVLGDVALEVNYPIRVVCSFAPDGIIEEQ